MGVDERLAGASLRPGQGPRCATAGERPGVRQRTRQTIRPARTGHAGDSPARCAGAVRRLAGLAQAHQLVLARCHDGGLAARGTGTAAVQYGGRGEHNPQRHLYGSQVRPAGTARRAGHGAPRAHRGAAAGDAVWRGRAGGAGGARAGQAQVAARSGPGLAAAPSGACRRRPDPGRGGPHWRGARQRRHGAAHAGRRGARGAGDGSGRAFRPARRGPRHRGRRARGAG